MMAAIRDGRREDLDAVAAIQHSSPEAAQWDPHDYLAYDFRVAVVGEALAGFIVLRHLAADEHEILNLAVAPEFRRNGAARRLVRAVLEGLKGFIFLELRESNRAALALYQSLGFQQVNRRLEYYRHP